MMPSVPIGHDYLRRNSGSAGFEEIDDFSFHCAEAATSPIPADQIFHNGRIKPINCQFLNSSTPGFSESDHPNPNLSAADSDESNTTTFRKSKRKALGRLFTEETRHYESSAEISSSSSSFEELAMESESASSDSYCVWEPKTVMIEKGNSWSSKFRGLLTRNVSGRDGRSRSNGLNR